MIIVAVVVAALQLAGDVDESLFRYTRPLEAPAGAPVRFEPDARMYGHSRSDFADLRILDADGEQVPWRPQPKPAAVPTQSVPLVARGSRDGVVTVVLDRGPVRPVIDRVELTVPADAPYSHEGDCVSFAWSVRARRIGEKRTGPPAPVWVEP